MGNRNKFLLYLLLFVFVVTMICFVVIMVAMVSKVDWSSCSFSKGYLSNIGNFLAGTLGVFLSFISFLLMWRTFSVQRKQFSMQDCLQRQSSFETTFFNLLNSLDQVRDNTIKVLSHTDNNIDSFTKWHEMMINTFRESDDDIIIKSLDVDSQIEATEGVVAKIYEKFIEKEGYAGFYFRYIYNVIRFTVDYWPDFKNRRKYVDLLCARLSDEEMSLIFYNALSKYGLNQDELPKFKEMLDLYQFFENLNNNYLVDRSHFRLYPHTDFKFLNRDERRRFLKRILST